jgi:hypothetical protein
VLQLQEEQTVQEVFLELFPYCAKSAGLGRLATRVLALATPHELVSLFGGTTKSSVQKALKISRDCNGTKVRYHFTATYFISD